MSKKVELGPGTLPPPAPLPRAGDVKVPLVQLREEHQHLANPRSRPSRTSSAAPNHPIAPTHPIAMAEQTPQPVAPIPRTTRPLSEALLNEKVRLALQPCTLLRASW